MTKGGGRTSRLRDALTRQRKDPAFLQGLGLNPFDAERRKRDMQWVDTIGFPLVAFAFALFLIVAIVVAIIDPR